MQFGLKLGSIDNNYTKDIYSLYEAEYFQYIELFSVPESFNNTIEYWKQFSIPFIIHAPHSFAGMNVSLPEIRENNKIMLQETFKFADSLKAEYIIFHSGVNGRVEETVNQLKPFIDARCLIENKPLIGLNGEKCLGAKHEEINYIKNELNIGFCLDFGHAICAANTLNCEPFDFIKKFTLFNPCVYHLTDGDYASEYDLHLHYGKGNFPIKKLIEIIPENAKVTNEAKHNGTLEDFIFDSQYLMTNVCLGEIKRSDVDIFLGIAQHDK